MKFRFCGDLDAPDWLLKEITVLAKISVVRIRILCKEIISYLAGGPIDYEKVKKQVLTHHDNWGLSDVKATVSALSFILTNGTKYNVEPGILSNELQQLGLPKEHGDSIAKYYQPNKDKLREHFSKQTLQLPRVQSIDWRVDYLLASNSVSDLKDRKSVV